MPHNTILLLSDEHNPFFSSFGGNTLALTPNMERMCREGTLFAQAYTPCPLCLPARSALMAGRRVGDIQTYNNCNLLLDTIYPSFGQQLSELGVHSVYFGKVDTYADGEQLGFSEMICPKNRKRPGDINFRHDPVPVREGAAARASHYGIREDAFDDDRHLVDLALDWLDHYDGRQPFVMVIAIRNPHFPQYAPSVYWNQYEDDWMPSYGSGEETAQHPYARSLRRHFQTDCFTDEQIAGLIHGYRADITFVDEQLGRLLDAVQQSNFVADTNVLYASDHGDMMGKFGMWWKCSLLEDSVRIPCLALGPDFIPGRTVQTPVDLHDVSATFFACADRSLPDGRLGTSLTEIPDWDTSRVVLSEYYGHGVPGGSLMIRKGHWKFIWYADAPCQMFNLMHDPDELENLYEKQPDQAAEMLSDLKLLCDPVGECRRAETFIQAQAEAAVTHGVF